VLAGSAASASAASRSLRTGISNVYSNEPAAFEHVAATGSTMSLSPVRWGVIAPSQRPASWDPENPADPHYDWEFIDRWVTNAVAAGLTPVLQIRGAPSWAEGCPPSDEAVCSPNPADLAAFTKALVRRFSGQFNGLPQVLYWEGLNEPNLSFYFQPQYEGNKLVSPYLYRTLLESFYGAVKSVMPSALVLAPGLAPLEIDKSAVGPLRFTRQLLCMTGGKNPRPTKGNCGGPVPFDIFDIHPYTTGSPTHEGGPNEVQMGDLGDMQRLLAAATKAGRIKSAFGRPPLWITEFSYDSKPPDPGGLSAKIEKQWIAEALYQAWLHRVPVFMWYSLDDERPQPDVPFNLSLQAGLYYWAPTSAEERPKPVVAAYRFPFVAFRHGKGLEFWGRTPASSGGKVVLEVAHGKGWRRLGTASANSAGIFKGFVKTGYGSDKKGAVRARFGGKASPGFSMRPVPDFPHPPFGA
jgi:hypothetical protein